MNVSQIKRGITGGVLHAVFQVQISVKNYTKVSGSLSDWYDMAVKLICFTLIMIWISDLMAPQKRSFNARSKMT